MADAAMTLFHGKPVAIRYAEELLDAAGQPAHAATFIRQRLIVLDAELQQDEAEQERILLHELFHFVWVRLGNVKRLGWEALLRDEFAARARGEAGWSAEFRKKELCGDDVTRRSRKWREYCCESFCDTASIVAGAESAENTLAARWMTRRRRWFERELPGSEFAI